MAAETEFVTCLKQIELVLCCVRVVTFDTISLYHDHMGTACLFGYHIGVAGEADLIRIRCKELAMGRCMGIMTACAFSGLHRRMDKRLLELFLECHMAGQAILPLRSWLQSEFIFLRTGGRYDTENTDRNKRRERPVPYIHAFIFHFFSPIWQSSHARAAKGGWTFSLNSFGSFEA